MYELNRLHMKLGIYTEIGELLDVIKKYHAYGKPMDIVNAGEEIADICWYLVNLATFNNCTILNIPTEFAQIYNLADVVRWAERLMGCFIESAYEHDFIDNYGHHNRISILNSIARYFKLDFFQLLTNNIDKLKVRYPEKFDAEKALNRNLDIERKELEK